MDIEKVVRDNIDKIIHMSLGTSQDNQPWVCEVHFAYDERLNIYFRSRKSTRHCQDIALNPRVAGNIVKQHGLGEYPLGLYFEGTVTLLEAGEEQNKAFAVLRDRIQIPDNSLEDAVLDDGHKFFKITVKNWYVFGKLDGQRGKKYQLEWNGGE